MRLMVQSLALALAAVICLGSSGWQFLRQVDFNDNAIEVTARIRDRDASHGYYGRYGQKRRLPKYWMTFQYTLPDSSTHNVRHNVSIGYSTTHNIGDKVTLWVDPETPDRVEIAPDPFSSMGLFLGMAGLAMVALSALSFGTAYAGLRARAAAARC